MLTATRTGGLSAGSDVRALRMITEVEDECTPAPAGNRPGAWSDWLESNVQHRTCSIDGCEAKAIARTWCKLHYERWYRTGDPLQVREVVPAAGQLCSIPDCGRPTRGRGWCQGHYRRWSVHGDPLHGGPLVTKVGPQPCPIAGCLKLTRRYGLCTAHSQRVQAHGDPRRDVPVRARTATPAVCVQDACEKAPIADGLCRPHYKRRYDLLFPEHRTLDAELRRARQQSNGGGALPITPRDWARMCIAYGGACAYCGSDDERLEVEHVIPLARGGRHSIGNVVPACGRCNRSKGSRLLVEWRYRTRLTSDQGRLCA